MDKSKNKITFLTICLSIGLLFMGLLRYSATNTNFLTPLSGYVTIGYVVISVFLTIYLVKAGLPLNKFGFGDKLNFKHIKYALFALILLRLFSHFINPLIEEIIGETRNLERFADVEGSLPSLIMLLFTSWTLAAFGEEFIYRIVLMRSLSYIFGDTRKAQAWALVIQAVMFGLIHAYQGPIGIIGSSISGFVFGTVVILSGWSIWPAALAHGTNNTIGIISLYLRN